MLHHSLATGLERDEFGATPVHDAADQNQLECLHVFYNHSVNLEPKDNDGLTPFDLAEEKQHFRCIQFLLNPKQSFENSRRKSFDLKVKNISPPI
jgi:ankyrin repeat protein